MKAAYFFGVLLLTILALSSQRAVASPMTQNIGSMQATLSLLPDPPIAGKVHATLRLRGVQASDVTAVRFSSAMPSMGMTGTSGEAKRDRSGLYKFDMPMQMAAPWVVTVRLSGKTSAAASFRFSVAPSQAAASDTRSSMLGMSSINPGDSTAWRTASFVLVGVFFIGVLVLRRDRRRGTVALVVVAALIVLGLAALQARYSQPAMDMASMQSVGGGDSIPVTLASISDSAGGASISAPASVEPYLTQNIVARAPGVLMDFSAYTGDRIRAGQIVAHLDEPELQMDAQAAAAQASAARSDTVMAHHDVISADADLAAKKERAQYWDSELAREKSLLDQGAVSRREFEDERAQSAAAQSAYESAQAKSASASVAVQGAGDRALGASAIAQSRSITAGYTSVVVPNDSVVMKRLVDPGVFVQPGTPILQVAVLGKLRIQAQVAQRDLSRIGVGTPMEVAFDDGITLHGRVSSVSPVIDSLTHTAIVEAIVTNNGAVNRAGSYARATLHSRGFADRAAFSVPSVAVVGGVTTAVWVDDNGAAHRLAVTVLSDDGTAAQITGALRRGMRVVVKGGANLEEGQAISEATP
ncbi:MAG: efflux RND transporter periplasmic adaptor subunit [Candidatus Eremiobacteraeota bacterium]|nr:efflux RND transporter periplasmic adaptor subunit [Candidatus Eremiobacteraeota bacterium]